MDKQLRDLIVALPRDSLLRQNLLVLRDAHRAGPAEEARLREVLASFSQGALNRLENTAGRGKR